jgi:hypothetical protein
MNFCLLPLRLEQPHPKSSFAQERDFHLAKARAIKKRRQLRRFAVLKLCLCNPRRGLQRVLNRFHKSTDHTDVLHPRRAFDT